MQNSCLPSAGLPLTKVQTKDTLWNSHLHFVGLSNYKAKGAGFLPTLCRATAYSNTNKKAIGIPTYTLWGYLTKNN